MSEQAFADAEPELRAILFHAEDVNFSLSNEDAVVEWLTNIIENEGYVLKHLNYIFCSDNYLQRLNLEYLQHDTLTDIITFPYSKAPIVEGDIFISVPRVQENAKIYGVSFEEELARVMAHGVLHLCGYHDKTPEEQKQMRQKEDESLSKYPSS